MIKRDLTSSAQIIERWAHSSNAQWVILGTGEPGYHKLLEQLARHLSGQAGSAAGLFGSAGTTNRSGFRHPSSCPVATNPCGLNQLYSLKYGSVPVVHATGGLADSIVDASDENLSNSTATGFSFSHYDAASLEDALGRACSFYENRPDDWAQLVATGMAQDWSWGHSARKYAELYKATTARVREAAVCA